MYVSILFVIIGPLLLLTSEIDAISRSPSLYRPVGGSQFRWVPSRLVTPKLNRYQRRFVRPSPGRTTIHVPTLSSRHRGIKFQDYYYVDTPSWMMDYQQNPPLPTGQPQQENLTVSGSLEAVEHSLPKIEVVPSPPRSQSPISLIFNSNSLSLIPENHHHHGAQPRARWYRAYSTATQSEPFQMLEQMLLANDMSHLYETLLLSAVAEKMAKPPRAVSNLARTIVKASSLTTPEPLPPPPPPPTTTTMEPNSVSTTTTIPPITPETTTTPPPPVQPPLPIQITGDLQKAYLELAQSAAQPDLDMWPSDYRDEQPPLIAVPVDPYWE